MPIIFQRCHVYNNVFFHNLNELAFCPPIIILLPVGLFGLLQALGCCKIERFTEMLIICPLIDFLSGGFESFTK